MINTSSLIESALAGDEAAFNQLVSLWYKRIYNYSLKHCGDEDLTADITQRTFIAVYRNLSKLKEKSRFKPWLYRIATNFCYEEGRRKSKSKTVPFAFSSNEEGEVTMVGDGEAKGSFFNPEHSFQQQELERILFDCLGQLSEDQRSVIIMKEYEGMKFHEIADALNASENTIKTRLYRGLKTLKLKLDEKNINKETIHYEL
uniref:RNA polymerase sigma factor n=1 Tax=Ekhidna sp. TaxID=2608089 RepID=UPI0032EE7014